MTVLAVDDHLPNLLVLDALLSEFGINVITANSGFDAIEIISKQQTKYNKTSKTTPQSLSNKTQISKAEARAQVSKTAANANVSNGAEDKNRTDDKDRIDLIFMDIQMPRMSGREAAQQIRNIENPEHRIPIIALTAHGLADERDKLLASGIDDYVGKPISQPQLLQVLQKWLDRPMANERYPTIDNQIVSNTAPSPASSPVPSISSVDTPNQTVSKPLLIQDESESNSLVNFTDTPKLLTQNTESNHAGNYAHTNAYGETNVPTSARKPGMRKDHNISRPLSLKKIRDNYLRDSQPRDDYLREPQRITQPRYQDHIQPLTLDTITEPPNQSSDYKGSENSLTTSAINELAILDWQDALTRSANKPDLAATLVIMMLDTIATEKEALAQAWHARDRNELSQIAHRILGASRYTGVPQLRQASQDLEDKCLLNIQHTTPAQFAMLKPYYETLLLALTNLQTLDLTPYPELSFHRLSENDMTWKMI